MGSEDSSGLFFLEIPEYRYLSVPWQLGQCATRHPNSFRLDESVANRRSRFFLSFRHPTIERAMHSKATSEKLGLLDYVGINDFNDFNDFNDPDEYSGEKSWILNHLNHSNHLII